MDNNKYKLILSAQMGNMEALEKLIKLEQNNIYTTLFYLKKDDNELYDIMQNVLVKVTRKINQLKNPLFFKTWLNKIIVNTYHDYTRKEFKYTKNSEYKENLNEIPDEKNNPSNNILYTELDITIKKAIQNMPNHYKIPITLREIQGLSYENISNITNTSIGTVKSRIARARGIIKNEVNKYTQSK